MLHLLVLLPPRTLTCTHTHAHPGPYDSCCKAFIYTYSTSARPLAVQCDGGGGSFTALDGREELEAGLPDEKLFFVRIIGLWVRGHAVAYCLLE
jgi:hypothetical protein